MTRYSLDVFLHITGAIAVFAGYGSLFLAVVAMRRATRSEQVQAITSTLLATRKVGRERVSAIDVIVIAGVLMIGGTGLDMAIAFHLTQAPWVDVATGGFILLAPIGPLFINPRRHRIADAAAIETSGPISGALRTHSRDPCLSIVMGASIGVLIGVVFLMTTKPDLVMSLVAIAIALLAGLALNWSLTRRSA